jgi:hypothetical protein
LSFFLLAAVNPAPSVTIASSKDVNLKSWSTLMLDSFRQQQASNIISMFWNFHREQERKVTVT